MALESKNSAVLVVTRLPAAARSQAGGRIRAREATAPNARTAAREASTPFLNLPTPGSQSRLSRLRLLWCSTCSCSK